MSFWDNLFTFTVVVLSFLFRHIFGARHRFVWTPIVFGFYLAGECGLIRLAGNWYLYQLIRLFITFAKAYLLCGFALAPWKRNPAVPLFLLFWGYFQFAVVFGEAPLGAFYFYLKSLEIVAIGYYAGIWAVTTPGGVRRLFLWGAESASPALLPQVRGACVRTGRTRQAPSATVCRFASGPAPPAGDAAGDNRMSFCMPKKATR